MRCKDTLFKFNEITTFFQYLYLDKDHRIVFNNGLTDLSLRMTDELTIACKNLRFPNVPEMSYNDNLDPMSIFSIIIRLKDQPAVEFPDRFDNRWDEIKGITEINLGLNIVHTQRR